MISVNKGLSILFFFTLFFPAVYAAEPVTPTGIPLSEIGNRIEELVANDMRESAPGLAVAVVKDGEMIFSL
jgi:CubicO group peptidase (beta-lactamase class C family)